MDLAAMMNDGSDVLHRGSVDHRQSLEQAESKQETMKVPIWAQIYGGSNNKVRDEKFNLLKQTRPEFKMLENMRNDTRHSDERSSEPPISSKQNKFADDMGASEAPDSREESIDGYIDEEIDAIYDDKKAPTIIRLPPTKASEVGPGGNASLTGLAPSMAAIIPSDDVSKVIAGWIFEQATKFADESTYKYLEVEFKLGTICDETTRMRHRFPALNESIIDTVYWSRNRLLFRSGVDPTHFNHLLELLDSIADANVTNSMNEITKENKLLQDDTYKCVLDEFGLGPKKIRLTTDDNGRFLECIYKQRIGDLYVMMPNSTYDVKMTLSIEHPITQEVIKPLIQHERPIWQRNKNRLSWISPGCQADLTSVHGSQHDGSVTKEVEIEANTPLIASSLTDYKTSKDGESLERFFEVIRYTIDSARYLVRNI